MYLTRRHYIWSDKREKYKVMEVDDNGEVTKTADFGPWPIKEYGQEVAYWRKANAIHKWFVDNIQEGEDNCGTYYVSRESLQKLHDLCKEILELNETDPEDAQEKAQDELPPQAGFFFGSTGIDQAYFYDLENTVKQLAAILAIEDDSAEYYYQSSW